jgi:hypothetical protein
MIYEKPKFSFNQVDKAGACIRKQTSDPNSIDPESFTKSFEVLFNYRSAHSFPLKLMYMTLRRRAKKIDRNALAAQRLKRLESILVKLHRNPSMQLSQMQDIGGGGCRAVLQNIKLVYSLINIYNKQRLNHTL